MTGIHFHLVQRVLNTPKMQLIEVLLPALAAMPEEHHAWLCYCPSQGAGEKSFIIDATVTSLPLDKHFGRILATLPLMMLGNDHLTLMAELKGFCDGAYLQVQQRENHKQAVMGAALVHRINANIPMFPNNEEKAWIVGTAKTPHLAVSQPSSIVIDLLKGGETGWIEGAKCFNLRLPKVNTSRYVNKMLYMTGTDLPTASVPKHTFSDISDYVKKVAALIDFAPQIVYLGGWQFDGHDTGYPSFDEIGRRMGGLEAYLKLKLDAAAQNCEISLDMNLDDAYANSPAFDERFIARTPDGALWRGKRWTRDESYIMGMAKYMRSGLCRERIERACAKYQLRTSVLVDVLSWFSIRHDWDKDAPASGVENLFEGKYRVLDIFTRQGIDVVSEELRYPMIGKLTACVDARCENALPFGGVNVPLAPIAYRHCILHGGSGEDIGKQLLYNAHSVRWHLGYDDSFDPMRAAKQYYLLRLPWRLLYPLDVVDYTQAGDMCTLQLTNQSRIEYHGATKEYMVYYQGQCIAHNGCTTCPVDENKIAFYFESEQPATQRILSFPMLPNWKDEKLHAYRLDATGRHDISFEVKNSTVFVRVPPHTPVIVEKDISESFLTNTNMKHE